MDKDNQANGKRECNKISQLWFKPKSIKCSKEGHVSAKNHNSQWSITSINIHTPNSSAFIKQKVWEIGGAINRNILIRLLSHTLYKTDQIDKKDIITKESIG